MFDIAPAHVITIITSLMCVLAIGLLAYVLDRIYARSAARQAAEHAELMDHHARLKRLRDWSRTHPATPKIRNTTKGPGLRPHPVHGAETHRPWVIPPADLPDPYATREPDSTIQICTLADVAEAPCSPAGHHAE